MNGLPSVIRFSGPFGYALTVLGAVVVVLSARALWTAAKRKTGTNALLRSQTNAVFFWGAASAVLGFLGQCHGTYLALSIIMGAPEISPQVVAEGFVISFVPTLFGLGILGFASVVWVSLRVLPGWGAGAFPTALALFMVSSCAPGVGERPVTLADGVWTFQAGPSLFLWEFTSGPGGVYSCMVHDVQGELKFMETPCASAELDGESLGLEMPNGVRYEGQVDLARGTVDGRLLYLDGTHMDAQLKWAPSRDFPTLLPQPEGTGPYAYAAPDRREDGWEVSHAEAVGVDPSALKATVDAILAGEAGFLKSVLVIRGGVLLLEEYFHGYGPNDLSPIHSVTKSVSSLLVGLAIQEGWIEGVDTPLLQFFPDMAVAGSGWEALTLEHLLTMSMALDWSPEETESVQGTGPEAFGRILARNVMGEPGREWEYVNMNVNLLAGILHQAVGEHAEDFAARALFGPLGITSWDWSPLRTEGFNLMSGSLRLRPRDMAKIGQMVLWGGEWQGRRVLEEAWVSRSLTPQLPAGAPEWGYGFLWWTRDVPGPDGSTVHAAFANGLGSQFIFLFPELELMVVTTGGNQENGKHLAIGEVLLANLLPGVKGL